jgi:hypothetical protein
MAARALLVLHSHRFEEEVAGQALEPKISARDDDYSHGHTTEIATTASQAKAAGANQPGG